MGIPKPEKQFYIVTFCWKYPQQWLYLQQLITVIDFFFKI